METSLDRDIRYLEHLKGQFSHLQRVIGWVIENQNIDNKSKAHLEVMIVDLEFYERKIKEILSNMEVLNVHGR